MFKSMAACMHTRATLVQLRGCRTAATCVQAPTRHAPRARSQGRHQRSRPACHAHAQQQPGSSDEDSQLEQAINSLEQQQQQQQQQQQSFDSEDELDSGLAAELAAVANPGSRDRAATHLDLLWNAQSKVSSLWLYSSVVGDWYVLVMVWWYLATKIQSTENVHVETVGRGAGQFPRPC